MSATTKFTIDAKVYCQEDLCGRLDRVVIDPLSRTLTHLVVDSAHREAAGRLVPIDLVTAPGDGKELCLSCTIDEFDALDPAEETAFLPDGPEGLGYDPEQMVTWPYYALSAGAPGIIGPGLVSPVGAEPGMTTYDRVPAGEVQVRRGEPVRATDGDVGRVKGLVIDPADRGVTHVLLEEGHLWGRKVVGIPIGAVTSVAEGVQVALTKEQLGDLPPVDFDEAD